MRWFQVISCVPSDFLWSNLHRKSFVRLWTCWFFCVQSISCFQSVYNCKHTLTPWMQSLDDCHSNDFKIVCVCVCGEEIGNQRLLPYPFITIDRADWLTDNKDGNLNWVSRLFKKIQTKAALHFFFTFRPTQASTHVECSTNYLLPGTTVCGCWRRP